jgi:lipoprotein signal peptidase
VLNDGAVIDFVSFGVGSLRTGVMNLADIMIFAGAGLLIASALARDAQAKRRRDEYAK